MRIAVAMSGGVDSSTAAALLKEQGHDVFGVTLKTHVSTNRSARICCSADVLEDALTVATALEIPFHVINCQEAFHARVIRPFAEAYRDGRTPNPCIECNDLIKFGLLWERARAMGAERLATGHYALIDRTSGVARLKRGVDRAKDQSYFLYRVANRLDFLDFPVGAMTKAEVRAHARRLKLAVSDKPASQEICFVGVDGYATLVEEVLGLTSRPGNIVDEGGRVLGRHAGTHNFTLGQRHGLGVAAPEPLYVTAIDPGTAEVRVGGRDELLVSAIDVEAMVWSGTPPAAGTQVEVQQRYRDQPKPAQVSALTGGRLRLAFLEPAPRTAPGQAAVLYQGDLVLGGGTVVGSLCASEITVTP
jgi:tRNA-uridine 2-sulfurtransferase